MGTRAAARRFGIHEATLRSRMRRGLSLDEAIALGKRGRGNKSSKPRVQPKLYDVNGEMMTIKQAAICYGVSQTSLRRRIIPKFRYKDSGYVGEYRKVSITEYLAHISNPNHRAYLGRKKRKDWNR
jgi:hypothetical protein